MTLEEVDLVLSKELGLLFDAAERGSARTYFLERVCWLPAQNTSVVRVAYEMSGAVRSIRLCVSSDNNNSVFVRNPIEEDGLRKVVVAEIEAFRRSRMQSVSVGWANSPTSDGSKKLSAYPRLKH